MFYSSKHNTTYLDEKKKEQNNTAKVISAKISLWEQRICVYKKEKKIILIFVKKKNRSCFFLFWSDKDSPDTKDHLTKQYKTIIQQTKEQVGMVSWINKKNNKYQNGQQQTPQVKAKEDNKR